MDGAIGITEIIDELSVRSRRPRYAFMVLSLLAEQASDTGRVGPFVRVGDEVLALREWVASKLGRMAANAGRRAQVEARVRAALAEKLPPDLLEAQEMIERHVEEQVRSAGADNFSRVIGELETAGYLKRFYEGRITKHQNRGGRRLLVVVLTTDVVAAFRRRTSLV